MLSQWDGLVVVIVSKRLPYDCSRHLFQLWHYILDILLCLPQSNWTSPNRLHIFWSISSRSDIARDRANFRRIRNKKRAHICMLPAEIQHKSPWRHKYNRPMDTSATNDYILRNYLWLNVDIWVSHVNRALISSLSHRQRLYHIHVRHTISTDQDLLP